MATYDINKVCWRSLHDGAFRKALQTDPAHALEVPGLRDDERALLLAGEVGKLHDLGAHSFLLSHLLRFKLFGLTDEIYSGRMRASVRKLNRVENSELD